MTDQSVKIEINQQEAIELGSTLIAIILNTQDKETAKVAIKIAHQMVGQITAKEDAVGLKMVLTMMDLIGPAEMKKLFENKMGKIKPDPKIYDQTKN